jgi:hypothetical protein
MVGAKKLRTLGLSWFQPGPYVQQGCARGTVLLCTRVPVEGWLQVGRERRLGLSWFRPGPYVQQGCARGTVLLCTRVPVEGWLQAGRERRRGLQVPKDVIEANANIVGRMESVRSTATRCPVSLRRGEGGSPPFYRPRRGRFTGVPHYFATCGGMAYSAVELELTIVLANLAPVTASWCALCLNKGDLEGGGVVVDRSISKRARGSR